MKLAHFHDLDPRYAHRLPPSDQAVDKIYSILKEKGAPKTCHVIGMSEFDGQDVDLRMALEVIVESVHGNFISCIPRKLAYFGGEEPGERYILES